MSDPRGMNDMLSTAFPTLSTADFAVLAERELKILKSHVQALEGVSAYTPNTEMLKALEAIDRLMRRARDLITYIDANLPERA